MFKKAKAITGCLTEDGEGDLPMSYQFWCGQTLQIYVLRLSDAKPNACATSDTWVRPGGISRERYRIVDCPRLVDLTSALNGVQMCAY